MNNLREMMVYTSWPKFFTGMRTYRQGKVKMDDNDFVEDRMYRFAVCSAGHAENTRKKMFYTTSFYVPENLSNYIGDGKCSYDELYAIEETLFASSIKFHAVNGKMYR